MNGTMLDAKAQFRRAVPLWAALLIPSALIACGADTPGEPSEAVERGRDLYMEPIEGGNTFACHTCHALEEPASDGLRRPGHALADATRRPSYKNGQVATLLEAVNSCLVEWMNLPAWTEDDDEYQALHAFLDSKAPQGSVEPLSFEIVSPLQGEALEGGDPVAGRAVFNESCAVCHGTHGAGTLQGPPVGNRSLDPDHVARRVRTSGRGDSSVYNGLTGGIMPFWAADRLSDDELRNIVAWLSAPPDEDDTGADTGADTDSDTSDTSDDTDTDTGSGGNGGPWSDCPETHPKIGQTAVLVEKSHGVAGVAEIVDDCTIVVHEFYYDGAGIEVRAYGGLGGNYHGGFAMSEDLIKSGGYHNEELVLTLPNDKTLDDLDGVSIWCVPVGIDFGSGMFSF